MRTPLALLLSVGLLAGCPATTPLAPVGYPSAVGDFGQYENFPSEIAGYRRGQITAYAPLLADYSIAYDRYDPPLQAAVTLYFYPRLKDSVIQLQKEEAEVLNAHPGATVSSRKTLLLEHNGVSYESSLTTFEFDEVFAGRRQHVASQLLLVIQAARTFKVRSTSPAEQVASAESAMLKLLQGVAWAP